MDLRRGDHQNQAGETGSEVWKWVLTSKARYGLKPREPEPTEWKPMRECGGSGVTAPGRGCAGEHQKRADTGARSGAWSCAWQRKNFVPPSVAGAPAIPADR